MGPSFGFAPCMICFMKEMRLTWHLFVLLYISHLNYEAGVHPADLTVTIMIDDFKVACDKLL